MNRRTKLTQQTCFVSRQDIIGCVSRAGMCDASGQDASGCKAIFAMKVKRIPHNTR